MKFKELLSATLFCAAFAVATVSHATEGGGSVYPAGVENYTCCAVPPPGWYGIAYAEHFRSDTLRDSNGDRIPVPGFKVRANVFAPRLIYVTPQTVAGGSLAVHAILPVVDLKVDAAGQSDSRSGIGDLTLGAALAWHHSAALHTLIALDVYAPTGGYEAGRLANIGRNYWAVQPLVGVSYIDPNGINADAKVMYTVNAKNKDTDYRSGQELIVDYALGWGLGNGWVVGAGGYVYEQTTDDRQAGATVSNAKGRAFAIGPSVRYDSGKGWFATLKYHKDSNVRNRAEGSALWLKAVVPF
ncbi:SphA family protein [Methylibium sp.]|uniref:SphA family protein n=1 Tax=Methylibium sp. TaxID=2067992 RepID=UPI003D0FF15A